MTYGRPGVYINETLSAAPIQVTGGANAAGVVLGAFAQGPDALTYVRTWYDFTKMFGGYNAAFPATFGVAQFFNNGGTELYVKRILHTTDDTDANNAKAATAVLPTSTTGNVATVTAIDKGAAGNSLRIQVTKIGNGNLYNITIYKEIVSSETDTNATNDIIVERFSNVTFADQNAPDYFATLINGVSNYVVFSNLAEGTPATQAIDSVIPLTTGRDGTAPNPADFALALATDGSSELETANRPLVIFAPELYTKFKLDGSGTPDMDQLTVNNSIAAWADSGTGFAVLEANPGKSVADVINYATSITPATSQAAVYYPHVYIADPLSRGGKNLRKVGPVGAVAGTYLASDAAAGPFKAPAGLGAQIKGAVSLERAFTPADLDSLNTGVYNTVSGGVTTTHYGTSVNAIRNIPGAGIVVMGARTLKQDGTANKYVNMRRSLIYIKKRLEEITQFAVFQSNDQKLWSQLTSVISVFLNEYRLQGGLRGTSPSAAYYVKADSANNTPDTIALGQVNIEVGVALEYPAEFVVINLSQTTGL